MKRNHPFFPKKPLFIPPFYDLVTINTIHKIKAIILDKK